MNTKGKVILGLVVVLLLSGIGFWIYSYETGIRKADNENVVVKVYETRIDKISMVSVEMTDKGKEKYKDVYSYQLLTIEEKALTKKGKSFEKKYPVYPNVDAGTKVKVALYNEEGALIEELISKAIID